MTPSKPSSRSPRRITSRTGALSFSHGVSSEHRRAALAAVGHGLDLDHAVGQAQRGLERVGEPRAEAVAHDETVDDHLDRVLALFVELDLLAELADGAVHPDAREPLALEVEEQLLVFALAPADDRRQHQEPGARRLRHDAIDHLLPRLGGDRPTAARAVR